MGAKKSGDGKGGGASGGKKGARKPGTNGGEVATAAIEARVASQRKALDSAMSKLHAFDGRVKALSQKRYVCTGVAFVTFNTTASAKAARLDGGTALFEGRHRITIQSAPPPDQVLWENLQVVPSPQVTRPSYVALFTCPSWACSQLALALPAGGPARASAAPGRVHVHPARVYVARLGDHLRTCIGAQTRNTGRRLFFPPVRLAADDHATRPRPWTGGDVPQAERRGARL